MSGTAIVTEIVQILVAGIVQLGQGIGSGISSFVTSLAYVTTGTGSDAVTTLSPFFVLICVFGAIALATGITRLVYNFLVSLGGSR